MRSGIVALLAAAATTAVAPGALAGESTAEPAAAKEQRLLGETGENTTVIDAFEKDDVFDANILLTFMQSWKSANIRRESNLAQPGLSNAGFVAATENVATYSESTTKLIFGGDVGIYHDLALSLRLPLVLSNSRELGDLDGSANNPSRFLDPRGDKLFTLPFKSPNRSGVDWFSAALNYAIFNQQRDQTKPTWVIGVEGRFSIGTPLHACNANAAIQCPDPANPSAPSRDPGIARGMNDVQFHSIMSRRYGYVEPYGGFSVMAEFPQADTDYGNTDDVAGTLLNRPPLVGTFFIGMEVFPWEHREQFQRLGLDFKAKGTYYSPGREYTELFDALGSSTARSLRDPNPGGYKSGPDGFSSVVDPSKGNVYFTGITDQQAYGAFGASAGVTWQTGEYVKFNAGLGLTYAQSHFITAADACNPNLVGGIGASGPCRTGGTSTSGGTATGVPNANHRPVIDLPGRRYAADDTTIVDLWINGVVMF